MTQPLWQIEHLIVRGLHQRRLDDVSITIHPGVTAIVGASGAGKTTLLNVLVGFETADSGSVRFTPPRDNARIFWAPPDHGLWPHLSVREHLLIVMPKRDQGRADELLRDFGLAEHADHRPDRLSQGQRARLSVARCLASDAAVLVMDEPLAHVDAASSPGYWSVIRRHMDARGASLVFSSHSEEAVKREAQQVVHLVDGRIVSSPESSSAQTPKPRFRAAFALLLALMLTLLLPGCDQSVGAQLPIADIRHHVMPPEGPMIPAPRSLTIGQKGELIVLDNAGRVLVYDRDMKLKRQWFMPEVEVGKPEGVCVLQDGRIAVADTHYHRVVFFDQQGSVLSMIGSKGTAPGNFIYPVKVIQDPSGFLYVAEYGSNDRVQKFTANGEFVLEFGTFGTGPQQLQRPSGIVWHEGRIYIADAINNRVQVFSDDGKFIGTLGQASSLKFPYDIALGPRGLLHVIEYGSGRLTVMTREGEVVGRFGSAGGGAGQFATPWGLAVDERGVMYVADTGNRRIVELVR